ncbi:uncharacterized protein LOC129582963 isoform X2 [Paramacrobiotus metropolitanus]|uniref:uncharacterized protein LOC129582963 isoform X2 n=1 Tax=Paramacrobiotus metropolitanus TaxID=2943436 RepID=UPI00244602CB|nr:uncharacterized protein LOC129582963 isoform X2 [Paramacrobiotus metropolitanus]
MLLWFGLCLLLAAAKAQSEEDLIPGKFPIPLDAPKLEENPVHQLAKANPGQGCYCDKVSAMCACCEEMKLPRVHLDEIGCAEIVYMPQSLGASFILEVDNFILVNKTVSARDPPPLCYTIPQIPLDAQLCLQVYDLDFNWAKLDISGCVNFQGKIEGLSILTIKLGCFNLPLKEAPHGLHEREEL